MPGSIAAFVQFGCGSRASDTLRRPGAGAWTAAPRARARRRGKTTGADSLLDAVLDADENAAAFGDMPADAERRVGDDLAVGNLNRQRRCGFARSALGDDADIPGAVERGGGRRNHEAHKEKTRGERALSQTMQD